MHNDYPITEKVDYVLYFSGVYFDVNSRDQKFAVMSYLILRSIVNEIHVIFQESSLILFPSLEHRFVFVWSMHWIVR